MILFTPRGNWRFLIIDEKDTNMIILDKMVVMRGSNTARIITHPLGLSCFLAGKLRESQHVFIVIAGTW
ncbi:MAG: hypothetical protein WCF90_01065 [Methanomicrobiales archaeon]